MRGTGVDGRILGLVFPDLQQYLMGPRLKHIQLQRERCQRQLQTMTNFFIAPFVARLNGKSFCGKSRTWLEASTSILHG